MAKPERMILTPIPMQYRSPAVVTCPACQQPIFRDGQHYVEARATGTYYCDTACLLDGVSKHSEADGWRWFEGELTRERQILNELEVVSYG